MTNEYQIDLYDEAQISQIVKRLALCFNLAAETYLKYDADILFKKGKELFLATTRQEIPVLNKDETSFMREQFLTFAAKQQGGRDPGWEPYPEALAEKANKIEKAAIKAKIIQ